MSFIAKSENSLYAMMNSNVLKSLAFLLLVLSLDSLSQVTIESNDLPQEGGEYPISQSLLLTGFDGEDTGVDYNWDFTDLEAISTDLVVFESVSETPFFYQLLFNNPFDPDYQADFGLAAEGLNIAEIITFEDVYVYFQNNDTAYIQVGYAATINDLPIPNRNEPRDVIYNLPLDFLDEDSSYTEVPMDIPDFFTYKLKQSRSYMVDGWGNVQTPFGAFDALRIKTVINATDSIVIPGFFLDFEIDRPTSTEYIWLSVDEGVPVLRIVESLGLVVQVEFKDEIIITDIASLQHPKLKVYPNPASDYFVLENIPQDVERMSLLNAVGSEVHCYKAMDQNRWWLPELSPGTYFVKIERQNGEILCKKLNIVHR